jgi:hypothetical protein
MSEFLTTTCLVLMGAIAMESGHANEGDKIQLPAADAEMFARWGYVRVLEEPATEVATPQVIENLPEIETAKEEDQLASAETESPKETAAQRKKREAAEAKATQEAEDLAAQNPAASQETE